MSKKTKGSANDNSDNYLLLETEKLSLDAVVPFDCFIEIKSTTKVVHWLREGSIYSGDRKNKLLKLKVSEVLVKRFQTPQFLLYMDLKELPANWPVVVRRSSEPVTESTVTVEDVISPEQVTTIAGDISTNEESVFIKGTAAVAEPPIKIFGSKAPKEELIFVSGGKPQDKAPPKKPIAVPKTKVDVVFLNCVIKSVQKIFQENFQIPIKFNAPVPRTEKTKSALQMDVASFIALTSQTIRGTMGLCFPKESYRNIMNQAMATNFSEMTHEHYNGCGEFLYTIFDSARPALEEIGYQIDRAIPILVIGSDLSIPHMIPDKGFSILFESNGGSFQLEIGIKTGM